MINDQRRLDGKPDFISCSIEIPNLQYMLNVSGRADAWVVLLMDPEPISRTSTLYCRHNAATANGAHIQGGLDGFLALFGDHPQRQRSASHSQNCPTHPQAEVLVRDHIESKRIAVAVVNSIDTAEQHRGELTGFAARTNARLGTSAEMFDPKALTPRVEAGVLPSIQPIDW